LTGAPGHQAGPNHLNRDDVERTVIAIVSRARGYPADKINPNTDLVVDLGIYGDDAYEILQDITKIYPIDFSEANALARFGGEGFWPWQLATLLFRAAIYPIQRWVLGMSPQKILGPGVLVSDVVDSVMTGKRTLDIHQGL
jgi:hypothetical protein